MNKCPKCNEEISEEEEAEVLNERLAPFSDRQIVVEVLDLLTLRQLRELVKMLERDF